MAVTDFTISLAIDQAARLLDDAIVGGSVTGERIDSYAVRDENGLRCLVLVYEKHYYRAGNRLTLTVTLENLSAGGRAAPGSTLWAAVAARACSALTGAPQTPLPAAWKRPWALPGVASVLAFLSKRPVLSVTHPV